MNLEDRKQQTIKKHSAERVRVMFSFLDKLNRYYQFPYSEITLYDFVEDLKGFTDNDLTEGFELLSNRESTYRLQFSEIKTACKEARSLRIRFDQMDETENKGVKIPENVKSKIDAVLKRGQ